MEITITKSDFEQALPVGAAANDSVYESVKPAIGRQLAFSNDALLGVAGMTYIEERGEDSTLMKWYKQLVCLSAFLSVLRQLDLVLTPTGFGVVSNDNLAPASKQRVDALEGQLRTQYWKTLAMTLNGLRSENWGATEQASHFINHLYDEYTYFFETHRNGTYIDWNSYQTATRIPSRKPRRCCARRWATVRWTTSSMPSAAPTQTDWSPTARSSPASSGLPTLGQ